MNCPICNNTAHTEQPHPEVTLHKCSQCGHRFSKVHAEVTPESYTPEYYEKVHRNWFLYPNFSLFNKIAERIEGESGPHTVIDVGCGRGDLLRYLAARKNTYTELVGLDLSDNVPNPDITFIKGDIITADVGRRFTAVVSLATIEHVVDINVYARRLRELCIPGGLVIVMTLNDDSILYATARFLNRFGFSLAFNRLYSQHHLNHFNPKSLSMVLEGAGLEPLETIFHNAPLRAMDFPAPSPLASFIFRAGVAVLFFVGKLTNRTYLQTIVCRAKK